MSTTCAKCSTTFSTAVSLARHLKRASPCEVKKEKSFKCKHCQTGFAFRSGLSRHNRKPCAIDVKSDSKQAVEKKQLPAARDAKAAQGEQPKADFQRNPFTRGNEIIITMDIITEAFTKSVHLAGYRRMSSESQAASASKYSDILLRELIELAHENPFQRNIYITPTGHAQVYVQGRWIAHNLVNAISLIISCIVGQLAEIVKDHTHAKRMPEDIADSIGWICFEFQHIDPKKFAKEMAESLAAHLSNLTPGFLNDIGKPWSLATRVPLVGEGPNYRRMVDKLGLPKPRKVASQGLPPAARNAAGPNIGAQIATNLMKIKDVKSIDVDVCHAFMDAVAKDAKQPLNDNLASEIAQRLMESNDPRAKAIMQILDTEALDFEPPHSAAGDMKLPPPRKSVVLRLLKKYLPQVDPATITVKGCREFLTTIAQGMGVPFSKEFMWELGPYIWRIHPEWKNSQFYKIIYPDGLLDRQLLAEFDEAADAADVEAGSI